MGSRKVQSYPFSIHIFFNICKFIFGAHRKHKILGLHVYLCFHPNSPSVTTLAEQAQTQAKVFGAVWDLLEEKACDTLSFSRFVFVFTFSVDLTW